ncbi:zinc ribbon domain-containing protein [Bacillus cereus]|uniref:Zinc ribbon domain-containing protein n=1 Tax=Bacillus cereus TaxID=1396 RepID=A0A2B3UDX0_BACCE|nr:zinc-ribbon domain-containing protein [Bacillus cereus]PFL22539.1 zinc ribbon domain-containing protein [Bacillus cereus]PFU45096.1 zinc ribbon domain-containing protein [Bacillus cereus]PGO33060.1 zinc ribbon domain-containing protein [Bacillus cereus]
MRYCTKCGNEANEGNKFCGQCGESLSYKTVEESFVNSNSNSSIEVFSLVGFITGLISWFINLWGLVGSVAIVFSILGLNKQVTGTSKTFAIVGMVSGIINVLYAVTLLI